MLIRKVSIASAFLGEHLIIQGGTIHLNPEGVVFSLPLDPGRYNRMLSSQSLRLAFLILLFITLLFIEHADQVISTYNYCKVKQ